MKSLMQQALGADWDKLPPALQSHYRGGPNIDIGHMDIEYPRFMQPVLTLLTAMGALLNRKGKQVPTRVVKSMDGERQAWQRRMTFPDGNVVAFNSIWVLPDTHEIIEYVNPVLGLQMAVRVEGQQLHYSGVRFIAKLGPLRISIPEWLALGHTTIVEEALDDRFFTIDFRLTHPWLGQVFRYSGKFENVAGGNA